METIRNMPADAKVWIYQSNKLLTDDEAAKITEAGTNFIAGWSAHGAGLKASCDVLYNRFIIIAVDEQQALASGCSIDKSVYFIKSLEQKFNLNLFDRLQVAYYNGNELNVCHVTEFEKLAQQGVVNASTIVFNNMITTKAAFDKNWKVPLKESWHKKIIEHQ